MNALSRREEDALTDSTKKRALRECDALVKQFADCVQGRTISLLWTCRNEQKHLQECMYQYTGPESMDIVRAEYIRLRDASSTTKPSPS